MADLDIKGLHDGPAIFRQFLAENGLSLPPGLPWDALADRRISRLDGLASAARDRAPNGRAILGGVDVKGDDGYVVAPPSYLRVMSTSHDGERGRSDPGAVRVGVRLPVPVALGAAVVCRVDHDRALGRETGRIGRSSSGDGIDAEKIMAHRRRDRQAQHHATTSSRAAGIAKHGTGPEGAVEVLAEVRAAWEAGDTAGMPWRELLTSVASARRFIQKQEQAERVLLAQWQAYISGGRRD